MLTRLGRVNFNILKYHKSQLLLNPKRVSLDDSCFEMGDKGFCQCIAPQSSLLLIFGINRCCQNKRWEFFQVYCIHRDCDPAFPKVDLHDWSTCRKTRTDLLASSDYFRATEIQKNYFCSQCTFLGFTLVLGVLVKLLEELIMRTDEQRELSPMVAILRRCLQQRNSFIIKSVRDLSSMNTLDA